MFARSAKQVHGVLAVADLPRLAASVYDPGGQIEYSAVGHVRKDGKPAIVLDVRGTVHLACQRCLGAVDFDVDSRRELVFVDADSLGDMSEEEPDADYLDAREHAQLATVVEDEVLLSLPMVPRHDGLNCAAAKGGQEHESPRRD